MPTDDPPELEPDAYTLPISAQPTIGEYGVHRFGRDISHHLSRLLGVTLDPPVYRENRWSQRPVPHACTFELTVVTRVTHTFLITRFDATPPAGRSPVTAFAIAVDGRRVPFDPPTTRDMAWQLANAVRTAVHEHDQATLHPTAGQPDGQTAADSDTH
ncbi:hypothetical protein GCM10009827_118790 [Dactylosporangium maewongense]|uniref:Uncharacterized protein n=1 Tax=Dactylosporangium maewongense TaxID=634393 RepID=A0ABP4PC35_9ACTN